MIQSPSPIPSPPPTNSSPFLLGRARTWLELKGQAAEPSQRAVGGGVVRVGQAVAGQRRGKTRAPPAGPAPLAVARARAKQHAVDSFVALVERIGRNTRRRPAVLGGRRRTRPRRWRGARWRTSARRLVPARVCATRCRTGWTTAPAPRMPPAASRKRVRADAGRQAARGRAVWYGRSVRVIDRSGGYRGCSSRHVIVAGHRSRARAINDGRFAVVRRGSS